MYRFLVLVPLLASCSAQLLLSPVSYPAVGHSIVSTPIFGTPFVRSPAVSSVVINPVAVPTSSQYHAQDELGQFAFGHSSANQARDEVKSVDGTVRGAYSYVDPTGKLNNVQYQADSNGFRVLGANNLPVAPDAVLEPVKDTPEVVEARAIFSRAFEEAQKAAAEGPETEAREEAKSRSRRGLLFTSPLLTTLSAKTIVKTSELKPIEDAKVPAATKLAEIKETEKEILTPITSYVSSPQLVASPVTAITRTIVPVVPAVAKTTVVTQGLKPVNGAKTPAGTNLAEITEEKKDIVTPIVYSAPLITSPYIGSPVISSHVVSSGYFGPHISTIL